jgi:hypothetical protein
MGNGAALSASVLAPILDSTQSTASNTGASSISIDGHDPLLLVARIYRQDRQTSLSFTLRLQIRGGMSTSEKDRLAALVAERYSRFEEVLFGDKRRYPLQEFKAFWEVARSYAELTKSDPLIHRSVLEAVTGLPTSKRWEENEFPNR